MQTIGLTFKDNVLVVKAGDTITLNITNCATFAHNITSSSLKIDPPVQLPVGGTDVAVKFTAPTQPGTYMFWCSTTPPGTSVSHAERGMTGEVIVQ
ncbi:MAG: cupredoxin domain-containing protein [Chloroflexi bacterium]|nr:cupredoxin domain-containing protein [Chloroflexota bacterium]